MVLTDMRFERRHAGKHTAVVAAPLPLAVTLPVVRAHRLPALPVALRRRRWGTPEEASLTF